MTAEEQSAADVPSAQEKIFLATLACIEREGIDGLTVRTIAREAGVNTAAINYYFGTKDKLVEQVLFRTLREGLDGSLDELEQFIAMKGGDIEGALREFLPMFFGQMVNWPRLAEAQLHDALTKQNYESPAIREVNSFLTRFLEIVRPILPKRSEADHWIAVLHLWLPQMFLGMLPKAFDRVEAANVQDPGWREVYVLRLLDGFLSSSPSQDSPA